MQHITIQNIRCFEVNRKKNLIHQDNKKYDSWLTIKQCKLRRHQKALTYSNNISYL